MNTIWETVTWDIARAGGFTAYILLALAVIVGLALSTKLQSPSRWPHLINSEMHNFLTLLGTIFLTVHILAVWIDPFTHFGLNEILVPFASHYRPVWMALGIVAFYLGIAIGISTWLRPRIGYSWWRRLHVLTLGIFLLATVHGIATGSDTQTWWALSIYVVSSAVVGSLLLRRLFVQKAEKRKHALVRSAASARSVNNSPRALCGDRVAAIQRTSQNRADVVRVK
ncbi:MAG: ferric reductase-like transmembrane domain-containing protein [Ktedonobacteraceae bacterium]